MNATQLNRWPPGRSTRRASSEPVQVWNLTRATLVAHSVMVANRAFTRRKGLLGINQLAPGAGLWIVPCRAVHTFGMRFSLDLLYLSRDHRALKVRSNVPPWRLSACLPAHSIVELGAGALALSGTEEGDRLELRALPPENL